MQWQFGLDVCSSCKPLKEGGRGGLGKSPKAGSPSSILRASVVFRRVFCSHGIWDNILSPVRPKSARGWGRSREWSASLPPFGQPLPILYKSGHQGISHNPLLSSQGAELALSSPDPTVLGKVKGSWPTGHLFNLGGTDSAPEGVQCGQRCEVSG